MEGKKIEVGRRVGGMLARRMKPSMEYSYSG